MQGLTVSQTIQGALNLSSCNEDDSEGGYKGYVTPTLEEIGKGAREATGIVGFHGRR
jgi:hypothetical protein